MRCPGLAVLVLVLATVGCSGPQQDHAAQRPAPKAKPDPWSITTHDPEDPAPAFLSNGLIGLRFDRAGNGVGESLLAADHRQQTGEEKILPLPNPVGIDLVADGQKLRPQGASDYKQSLDFRTGQLATVWKQTIDGESVTVTASSVVSPRRRLLAQRWEVECSGDIAVQGNFRNFSPGDLTAGFKQIPGDLPISVSVRIPTEGMTTVFEMAVNVGKPEGSPAKDAVHPPDKPVWFDELAREAQTFWTERWKTDIVIDGPIEDQQAVRSILFQLRSNINPLSGYAPGPYGLTNAAYNAHVFWDADLWVFPALMLLDPDLAKAIPDYRLRMLDHRLKEGLKPGDQPYPWESSVSGKETVPGPSQKEIHIVGSVSLALEWARALGLADPASVETSHDLATAFYEKRAVRGPNGTSELKDVMSPDEFHIGDNDLYTNMLASWLSNRRPERSYDPRFVFPRDAETFLTYDGDRLRTYKQAAAILTLYPLQNPQAEAEAEKMMNRFAGKATENGPAMSSSLEALIWARLGQKDKAYETWRTSWQRYTSHALGLFNEKPRRESSVFVTGAGGCVQTILFGFAGFRIDSMERSMAVWESPLIAPARLSVKPSLPSAWKRLTIKNATVLGKKLTFDVTQNAVKVTQGDH